MAAVGRSGGMSVTAKGLDSLRKRMKDRRDRLGNLRAVHKKAAVVLFAWVQRNFEREGAMHDDGRWRSLAESTKAERAKKGYTGKILQRTGTLKQGFNVRATRRKGWVRSTVPYGVYHQSRRPRRKLPRRPFLPDEDQARKIVMPVFRRHVKTSLRDVGTSILGE